VRVAVSLAAPILSHFNSGVSYGSSDTATDAFGLLTINAMGNVMGLRRVLKQWARFNKHMFVFGGGGKTLSGTLDRVRITTVNGTDTFDAGTINILYE
jgi:hypothetical protein